VRECGKDQNGPLDWMNIQKSFIFLGAQHNIHVYCSVFFNYCCWHWL